MYVFNEVGTCWGHYMESLCVSLLSVIWSQRGNFILGQMKRRRDRSTFLHSWPVAGNSLPFTLHIHGWQAVWLIILIKLTPANDGVFMKRMTLQEPSHRRYSFIFYCCKMKERWKAALSKVHSLRLLDAPAINRPVTVWVVRNQPYVVPRFWRIHHWRHSGWDDHTVTPPFHDCRFLLHVYNRKPQVLKVWCQLLGTPQRIVPFWMRSAKKQETSSIERSRVEGRDPMRPYEWILKETQILQ